MYCIGLCQIYDMFSWLQGHQKVFFVFVLWFLFVFNQIIVKNPDFIFSDLKFQNCHEKTALTAPKQNEQQ